MKDYLPISFFRIVSEIIRYAFQSFFRLWFISIPLFILLLGLIFLILTSFPSWSTITWILLTVFLVASVPAFIFQYRHAISTFVSRKGLNIGITECVMIKDKEYLDINFDSDRIVQKQLSFIQDLATLIHPFNINQITVRIIRKPRLFYFFKDLFSLKSAWVGLINPDGFLCVLTVIKDIQACKLQFEILYPRGIFNSTSIIEDFNEVFSIPIKDEGVYDDYIIEVSKIYASILGQCVLDLNIGEGRFDFGHKIVDDCRQLFIKSILRVEQLVGDIHKKKRNRFKQLVLCNFERYTAVMYLNQDEYLAAVSHVFEAITLHPFYPYRNYEEYKKFYNKKYVITIAESADQIEDELKDDSDKTETSNDDKANVQHLIDTTDHVYSDSFEDMIKVIIHRASSGEVNKKIEDLLKTSFSSELIQHIIKGEVIKYLPMGDEKYGHLYIERLPEVIKELEILLEKDPDFLITYTRLGALKIIAAGSETEENKRQELLESGIKTFGLGQQVFTRLGFDIRSKNG